MRKPPLPEIYAAFVTAGDDGLNATLLARLWDPVRSPGGTARFEATAALNALLTAGVVVEKRRGRWIATGPPDWTPESPVTVAPRVGGAIAAIPGVNVTEADDTAIRASQGRKRHARERVELDPELWEVMTSEERLQWRLYQVQTAGGWREWVTGLWPERHLFAAHHVAFWDFVWNIRLGEPADPHIDVWGRGGGKSSSVEMAVAAVAALNRRRYVLYVGDVQQQADNHIDSIAELFGSELFEVAYPDVANREVSKYGTPKAWRRNRLRCRSGFTVDALGLDTAARGLKIGDQRPDLIVIDDVDRNEDTPATTSKKVAALTRAILPTGSQDVIVIGVQNLVHPESIFARLVSTGQPGEPDPADFLVNRTVVGPIPVVRGLEYEQRVEAGGVTRHVITGGEPTWDGMPLPSCQHELDLLGLSAFLAECQHEEPDLDGGMFGHLDFSWDGPIRVREDQVPQLLRTCVWVDPAVTNTDRSDSCGVTVDSLGVDRKYYRRWAWEQRASPDKALGVAVRAAFEFNADVVGVETDQGGDTWEIIFRQVLQTVMQEMLVENGGEWPDGVRVPVYASEKAGSTQLGKTERASKMLAEYMMGRIKHVESHVLVLEKGLRRFPKFKPLDVADAAYWSWRWLAKHGGNPRVQHETRARAPRGQLTAVGPQNIPGAAR